MNTRAYILAAAALAYAGAVQAQSSVTLWGVVDVTVQRTTAGGVGNLTQLANSSLQASQLGFRGVEDLGGGLKAGFWLEGSLNPDNGTGRPTNTNNQASGGTTPLAGGQGFMFDRRSTVMLSGSWGELRLGHDFSPPHYNVIFYDAFASNGTARVNAFTLGGVTAAPLPTTVTTSNSFSYWTPQLAGFSGLVMLALGENNSGAANKNDGDMFSVRVGYKNGPFDAGIATNRTRYVSTAATGDYSHTNLGASWDAGLVKVFGLMNQSRVELITGTVRKNTYELGAHVRIAPNGRIRLAVSRLDDRSSATLLNANGTPRSDNDASMWGVGYVHDLSKRTALYGTYSRLSNTARANYAVTGGIAPLPGQRSTGLELGLRHQF